MPVSEPLRWLVVLLLLGGMVLLAVWPVLPRVPVARRLGWAPMPLLARLVGVAACAAGILALLLTWPLMFWLFLAGAAAAALVSTRVPAR